MKRKNIHPEMCEKCLKVDGDKCSVYAYPSSWHRKGGCPMKKVPHIPGQRKKASGAREKIHRNIGALPAGYWEGKANF